MKQKRPLRIEGDVAYVPLSSGRHAIVDASLADLVGRYNWADNNGYAVTWDSERKRTVRMHRLVAGLLDNSHPFVDHINGDGRDNRLANLRTCTQAENCRNQKPNHGRRFKGTYKMGRSWRAQVFSDGVPIYVDGIGSELQAALEHDRLALLHHGKFARLNFPSEVVA